MSELRLPLSSGEVTVRVVGAEGRTGVDLDVVANANPLATLTAAMNPPEAVSVALCLLLGCGVDAQCIETARDGLHIRVPPEAEQAVLLPADGLPGSLDGHRLGWPV